MVTFVVRLWDSAEPAQAAGPLRGIALHVASGRTTSFVGVDALLAFFSGKDEQSPSASGHATAHEATAM